MDCIHESTCHENCNRCDDYYKLEEELEKIKKELKKVMEEKNENI